MDELSLKLMMPASELKEHLEVVSYSSVMMMQCSKCLMGVTLLTQLESRKKLLIHGPQGSGKSHLARAFAEYIKVSTEHIQEVWTGLVPS